MGWTNETGDLKYLGETVRFDLDVPLRLKADWTEGRIPKGTVGTFCGLSGARALVRFEDYGEHAIVVCLLENPPSNSDAKP
jgi:hypothetical protein